jgi:hypothetical protein
MTKRNGIYEDLPEQDYHADDALGSSDLKELYISPQTWVFKKLYPEAFEKKKRNPALIIGSALHKLTLEGMGEFIKSYRVNKEDDLRKKDFHKWFVGEDILKKSEYEDVKLYYRILQENYISKKALHLLSREERRNKDIKANWEEEKKDVKSEVSCFWEVDGIRFKCRFDLLQKGKTIVDLKTATFQKGSLNAALNNYMADYQLDIQTKHYLTGFLNCYGIEGNFINIIIEKSPPYRVALRKCKEDLLDFGQRKLDVAIHNYKYLRDNNWKMQDSYDQQVGMDDLPRYNTEKYRLEERKLYF